MGKVTKHLEARTKEERIKVRKNLGKFKELTVQPQTRRRYEAARQQFYYFLRSNKLSIPSQVHGLTSLLGEYLVHLWCTGEGRGKAADTLAVVQDLQPHTKRGLLLSWRLLKTWQVNGRPCRAPPLPEICLQAMVGWAIFKNEFSFALSLMLGFYGLLRTGELLDVKAGHGFLESSKKPAVVSLGLTKGGKRMGATESVSISVELVLLWLKAWKQKAPVHANLCDIPARWRSMFVSCIQALGLESLQFRPYSLRRGGATHWFSKHGSLDRVIALGRWQVHGTARIYINEGLSAIAEIAIPKAQLKPFLTIFCTGSPKPRFTWALFEQ